jgi:hypothetical protein
MMTKTKLRGLSPRPNYTDRVAAACRRSWWQIGYNDDTNINKQACN